MKSNNLDHIALIRNGTTCFSHSSVSYIVNHDDQDGVAIYCEGTCDPQLARDIMVEFNVVFSEVNDGVVALINGEVRQVPKEPEVYETLADTFRGVSVYLAGLASLGILAAMVVYLIH